MAFFSPSVVFDNMLASSHCFYPQVPWIPRTSTARASIHPGLLLNLTALWNIIDAATAAKDGGCTTGSSGTSILAASKYVTYGISATRLSRAFVNARAGSFGPTR